MFTTIVCFDDLLRKEWWPAKNFFYDLIREPIRQATCGLNIQSSPRNGGKHNLAPTFDEQVFVNLVKQGRDLPWNHYYHAIRMEAAAYLSEHLAANSLVLSYEMPPWLEAALLTKGVSFLDIRISPLRFASDLYVALRTNNARINEVLDNWRVPKEEVRLEASLVAASVRHLRRYGEKNHTLSGTLVYIGQTGDDASIVNRQGEFIRVDAFAEIVHDAVAKLNRFAYKPHPSAGVFAKQERRLLSEMIGMDVKTCHDDIYELLGAEDKIELIGISSGSLQEAYWFDKAATMLYKPVCPILPGEGSDIYAQIRFADFVSPLFWHSLCAPGTPAPKVEKLPIVAPNTLRQLHNVWWGYSTFLTKNRHLWIEAFEQAGAFKLNTYMQKIKNKMRVLSAPLGFLARTAKKIKIRLLPQKNR